MSFVSCVVSKLLKLRRGLGNSQFVAKSYRSVGDIETDDLQLSEMGVSLVGLSLKYVEFALTLGS